MALSSPSSVGGDSDSAASTGRRECDSGHRDSMSCPWQQHASMSPARTIMFPAARRAGLRWLWQCTADPRFRLGPRHRDGPGILTVTASQRSFVLKRSVL